MFDFLNNAVGGFGTSGASVAFAQSDVDSTNTTVMRFGPYLPQKYHIRGSFIVFLTPKLPV